MGFEAVSWTGYCMYVPAAQLGVQLSTFRVPVAVALAAINVFGGFLVTQRMLDMFKKKGK